MLLKQIFIVTTLWTVLTFETAYGKRKKLLKHAKRPKEKNWKLRAGHIEGTISSNDAPNDTSSNLHNGEETYSKYMATMTPQTDDVPQTTSSHLSYPTTIAYEPAQWESQAPNNVRKQEALKEFHTTSLPQYQSTPQTSEYESEFNPKFNNEIDALTKNLQQISNDWYYNVRFHCANSWKMIQDILSENRKALNDWQSTLSNIIDMFEIEDGDNADYKDLEDRTDHPDKGSMDYDSLTDSNSTDRYVDKYYRSKWPDNDKDYYTTFNKATSEYSEIEKEDSTTESLLKHGYKTMANETQPGNLRLHVKLDANDSLSDLKHEGESSNRTKTEKLHHKTTPNLKEEPLDTTERLKYEEGESTKAVTEAMQPGLDKYDTQTSDSIKLTTDNSWLNYYSMRQMTDSSRNTHYDTTERADTDNPWRYYYENVLQDTTLYDSYTATTESYWKYYYQSLNRETTEATRLPYERKYDEMKATGIPDLRKYQNRKQNHSRTAPQELMVKASQKTGRKRKKKKKKLYSVRKSNVRGDKTMPFSGAQKPDDEISSDINLVEALRMYWKQSILECLSKYMKEVKDEEKMARTFDKRMKILTASSLANFTEECKNGKKGEEEKDDWSSAAWQKLKEKLTGLHQELERRYLNHEVQNLQITMGIETCRQVGLAYENTMHRQVKAIYSTAVKGRYRNRPVASAKYRRKYQKHH